MTTILFPGLSVDCASSVDSENLVNVLELSEHDVVWLNLLDVKPSHLVRGALGHILSVSIFSGFLRH